MKEAYVSEDTTVIIRDVPIPKPGKDEVLIKVIAFGTNPKDWKVPVWGTPGNSGDDVAGIIEAVGEEVFEFQKGDRVAGFHIMMAPGGTFAEFAVVPAHTTFRIPPSTSFEEAATIPLAALTSAIGLFYTLQLPSPWQKRDSSNPIPLVVNGASSAVGAFAIKLALYADIHPIIAIGSSNSKFITDDLVPSKGDSFVDYTAHETAEALTAAIKDAITKSGAPNGRAFHALDAVSENGSVNIIGRAISGPVEGKISSQQPKLSLVLPNNDQTAEDNYADATFASVGFSHSEEDPAGKIIASVWSSLFSKGLHQGWLKPHPHQLIPDGLNGLEKSLQDLRAGRVRAKKMVGRIADTPELQYYAGTLL